MININTFYRSRPPLNHNRNQEVGSELRIEEKFGSCSLRGRSRDMFGFSESVFWIIFKSENDI